MQISVTVLLILWSDDFRHYSNTIDTLISCLPIASNNGFGKHFIPDVVSVKKKTLNIPRHILISSSPVNHHLTVPI